VVHWYGHLLSNKGISFVTAERACLEARVMGCHCIHQTPRQWHSHVYQLHIHIYLRYHCYE